MEKFKYSVDTCDQYFGMYLVEENAVEWRVSCISSRGYFKAGYLVLMYDAFHACSSCPRYISTSLLTPHPFIHLHHIPHLPTSSSHPHPLIHPPTYTPSEPPS